ARLGISRRGDPTAHAALPDVAAEPALHGHHARQAARGTGRQPQGPGDGRAAGGHGAAVHGAAAAVAGGVDTAFPGRTDDPFLIRKRHLPKRLVVDTLVDDSILSPAQSRQQLVLDRENTTLVR